MLTRRRLLCGLLLLSAVLACLAVDDNPSRDAGLARYERVKESTCPMQYHKDSPVAIQTFSGTIRLPSRGLRYNYSWIAQS